MAGCCRFARYPDWPRTGETGEAVCLGLLILWNLFLVSC